MNKVAFPNCCCSFNPTLVNHHMIHLQFSAQSASENSREIAVSIYVVSFASNPKYRQYRFTQETAHKRMDGLAYYCGGSPGGCM